MAENNTRRSFLALEGLHVFITGAARGIGSAAVKEFLLNGAYVTAFDVAPVDETKSQLDAELTPRLHYVVGSITNESSLSKAFQPENSPFGQVNILVANAGTVDESNTAPIWDMPTEKWDANYNLNVRGTFLTIKHFLKSVETYQKTQNGDLKNTAIVITGSDVASFGQAYHAEYSSGKSALQYGLLRTVKNEIVRLNSLARINVVAPGYVRTPLVGSYLDNPDVLWAESQATVALKRPSEAHDVARAMAFLASHRAAAQITGEVLHVHGGQEGRLLWQFHEIQRGPDPAPTCRPVFDEIKDVFDTSKPLESPKPRRMRICLSVDFDAISGYLGTGHLPENTLNDYSAGVFSANVGVRRLLRLFSKYSIADKLTWFIPGHSIETFPECVSAIVESGAEIGLHAYSHEGAYALNEQQEKDIIEKCISLVKTIQNGKAPVGWRAPLYQVRENTIKLLQENDFLYDSSMGAHDAQPYLLSSPFAQLSSVIPDYTKPAETWMVPSKLPRSPLPGTPEAASALVEIPCNWWTEDMTPLGFYPYTANTQGYISTDVVEKIWLDRFHWLWENESFTEEGPSKGYGSIYSLVLHPESAGRLHIIGMIERFIRTLQRAVASAEPGEITFETMESVALSWKRTSSDVLA